RPLLPGLFFPAGAAVDVFSDPLEKTVMFLNVPFCREAAALSGLSDEPESAYRFIKPYQRGVLPRWQNPGRTEHLETPRF
ncbi:hypothetical protein, partial [Eisenbergiella tayi]|uniref:hypothetical protein n=1 Tax=Eisenbergiella tayi TaxID=1432052 RepID=UPI003AF056D2